MKRMKRGGLVALAAGLLALVGLSSVAGATITGATSSKTSALQQGDVLTLTATVAANKPLSITWCAGTNLGTGFDPAFDCSADAQIQLLSTTGTGAVNTPFTVDLDPAGLGLGQMGNGVVCDATHPCRLRLFEGGTLTDVSNQAFVGGIGALVGGATCADTCLTFGGGAGTQVPEAPYAVLLPLGTAAVLGAAFFVLRRRRPLAA
jgi:hypothetical protein